MYKEDDLTFLYDIRMDRIDNECDDDCHTDDETLSNGINYNQKKLHEHLCGIFGKSSLKGSK